ncbi:pyridoxal phosphate-dependent aminotransferase [Enterococcus avium]|uniref:cysteine-S-conjugate beta-lyase n=1 Tax=Enterococcus avium TaxID=33945 RepID=A0ABD5FCB3_ENTAV|nr:MalY/PatB family protein [Enterococcus avium]MDT2437773.1 pyridoxal phosphate-dependent aminotransferase [Enterococcus avium]MDT2468151.1 pyridoxal phosphate-dependent aminotransferase [Enterococcus avium]MDT2484965.1 pyridoxal phosphate-dependent aminotransferase [Enterococcus avium]MDT2507558.1 pyridoxal phosphate-dependent aminotransferase [Enterococcus avium]MDT2511516.1 pyridoxal phosphate-dependent aminotransferase [Enterococcus avium]
MTNFEQPIDRLGSNSVKWDAILKSYNEENLLPLWIADMDFKAPAGVLQAYQKLLEHGILGYADTPDTLYTAISNWEQEHFKLAVRKEEILFFSGVLAGIATAIQAFTKPNNVILIHDPVYPPFANIITTNRRQLVRSQLVEENGHFVMDLADMEEKFKQHQVKVMILCNPHNPGGRVWTKKELYQLGELCQKYQVLVLSDEIHQDLVFPPNKMTSFFNAGDGFSDFSLQFTSMTKTFNLAGIKNSVVFVKNEKLRSQLIRKQEENFQQEINTFGLVGMEAAYETGEEWLAELLPYIQSNITYTMNFFQEQLPKVKIMKPEGTYLLWLDFSEYDLSDKELEERFVHKGKVVLNTGVSYGPSGKQHMRLNVACPRVVLEEGLNRIVRALS